MFNDLGERLGGILERLRGRGVLTGDDVATAVRSLGDALLEADVAASLVDEILEKVSSRAVGKDLLESVTPGQQVAKIVHDVLVEALGGGPDSSSRLRLDGKPPAVILMVGLQGVGKTTTSAKLAKFLKSDARRVLLASLDVSRPAAREQLRVLGESADVKVVPEMEGEMPVDIARRAVQIGELGGHDVVVLDTAGRGQIDEALMREMSSIHGAVSPSETLLVVDSLSGQNAASMAREFSMRVPLSGLILTRVDGDSRGGAALSARHVSGVPIKFMGVGEGLDALEPFQAERIASRILGMGDVAGLVEKAQSVAQERGDAEARRKKPPGTFDMEDLAEQLRAMGKMGGLGGILGMLPGAGGMGKLKKRMGGTGLDDGILERLVAIISSMTRGERSNPKIFNASRKRRVAQGSGSSIQEVNRLLKFHRQIADVMRKSGKHGFPSLEGAPGAAGMGGMPGMPFGAGGMGMPAGRPGGSRGVTKRRGSKRKKK
ncbi:MAG: signal recognition particle protein [Hyphomicrobiales bacterium]|nr:signal recognition particle protein [Hyphomicrobiales bacterium]